MRTKKTADELEFIYIDIGSIDRDLSREIHSHTLSVVEGRLVSIHSQRLSWEIRDCQDSRSEALAFQSAPSG